MKDFFKKYKIDIIIFSVALVARALILFADVHASGGDFVGAIHGDDGYYEISRGLAEGHGFTGDTVEPFRPNALRTPLYIYFIALVLILSHSYACVIAIQIVLGALIPVLGRHIALKLCSSNRVALWTGILLSFQPYLVVFSVIFYTETFFIFFFLIFILLFLSYLEEGTMRMLVWSSVVLGLATLTKTTVEYLPVLLVPIILWNFRTTFSIPKRILHSILFVFVFLCILSPWFYRNYREFGVVGMTAQPAYNAYVYLVPSVLSLENGTSFDDELRKFVTTDESSGNVITLANGPIYTKKAFDVLRQHPVGVLKSIAVTVIAFYTHDGMLTVLQHAGYVPQVYIGKSVLSLALSSPPAFLGAILKYARSPLILVLIMRIAWIGISAFFLLGFLRFLREKKGEAASLFLLSVVLYFTLTSAVGGLGVNARYRMPIEPIIFTFALTGFVFVRNAILALHEKDE